MSVGKDKLNLDKYDQIQDDVINEGDPIVAPPCPYTIQPENIGNLLWICGPPGTGKSTSAWLLSKKAGYVYYEGDCFYACKHPYIPADVQEPSLALQRNLVGEGLQERKNLIQKYGGLVQQITAGEPNWDNAKKLCRLMCEDSKKERLRIGGKWAIAGVLFTREMRDVVRECLGEDLVIVVLNIGDDDLKARLSKRHNGNVEELKKLEAIKFNVRKLF